MIESESKIIFVYGKNGSFTEDYLVQLFGIDSNGKDFEV